MKSEATAAEKHFLIPRCHGVNVAREKARDPEGQLDSTRSILSELSRLKGYERKGSIRAARERDRSGMLAAPEEARHLFIYLSTFASEVTIWRTG